MLSTFLFLSFFGNSSLRLKEAKTKARRTRKKILNRSSTTQQFNYYDSLASHQLLWNFPTDSSQSIDETFLRYMESESNLIFHMRWNLIIRLKKYMYMLESSLLSEKIFHYSKLSSTRLFELFQVNQRATNESIRGKQNGRRYTKQSTDRQNLQSLLPLLILSFARSPIFNVQEKCKFFILFPSLFIRKDRRFLIFCFPFFHFLSLIFSRGSLSTDLCFNMI